MTGDMFKKRYAGHKSDLTHKENHGTALSRYVWKIKDIIQGLNGSAKEKFKWNINWEVIEKAPTYKPGSKNCNLCIAEKHHILREDNNISLNVRSELLSMCRHKAKWKLGKLLK